MNLNANLKKMIVQRFRAGEDVRTIAVWYDKTHLQIEEVLRQAFSLMEAQQSLPLNDGQKSNDRVAP